VSANSWREKFKNAVIELEARVIMPDRPPSLLPTLEGLKLLDLKYDPKKVIMVAGTNGKGSTAATLEALLVGAGRRVGLYTSPHLIETTERIRIQSKNVDYEKFCLAHDRIKKALPHKVLSHFEMLTLMALEIFLNESPVLDTMIFEVGLGGTWDATNAIEHKTSVITTLGLDHQDILGESLWEIAKNKMGIVREGDAEHKVIHAPWPSEIAKLLDGYKNRSKARFIERESFKYEVLKSAEGPSYFIDTKWGRAEIRLPGLRGAQNIALALTVFSELGFDPSRYLQLLHNLNWPGRMDSVNYNSKKIYFSGDHNPQGVQSLKEILEHHEYENIYLLIGVGKSKDYSKMLEGFFSIPRARVVLTETPFRGLELKKYGAWSERAFFNDKDPMKALSQILEVASPKDMILVSGSLYLVGAVLAKLKN